MKTNGVKLGSNFLRAFHIAMAFRRAVSASSRRAGHEALSMTHNQEKVLMPSRGEHMKSRINQGVNVVPDLDQGRGSRELQQTCERFHTSCSPDANLIK